MLQCYTDEVQYIEQRTNFRRLQSTIQYQDWCYNQPWIQSGGIKFCYNQYGGIKFWCIETTTWCLAVLTVESCELCVLRCALWLHWLVPLKSGCKWALACVVGLIEALTCVVGIVEVLTCVVGLIYVTLKMILYHY